MNDPHTNPTDDAQVTPLGRIDAPWGKEVAVEAVRYPSGLRLARVRIRENRRFTVLDVDAATAAWLTDALAQALEGDGGPTDVPSRPKT